MPDTVHGTRHVGDTTMQVDEDELGPGVALVGVSFLGCDTFKVGAPGHYMLPPVGTEVRVQERGWAPCPCCRRYQPQLRGGGVGVIECSTIGQFLFYVVDEHLPALLPQLPPAQPMVADQPQGDEDLLGYHQGPRHRR